ncbi:MAG TPA: hypothetical protein VMN39_10440 [Longimicrobiaceae bacterium]|nr:hypothetical protein [Longimicrobiaceae bacterium]
MPATRAARQFKTILPTPRRFLRCVACRTIKKERTYALCSECYKLGGTLDRGLFTCFARHAEREGVQYSYRSHPEFEKACRIYQRRRERARGAGAADLYVAPQVVRDADSRDRYRHEPYDGLGSHELSDILDWQMHGIPLPKPERSEHRELSDDEIAGWDARVDAWAEERGVRLADDPAPEIQPWGYVMDVAGARIRTDDLA